MNRCRFAWGTDALLDFACGRGGDIWKWIESQVKYVKGIDLSPGEVAEARQRYEEAQNKQRSNPNLTRCEFLDTPKLGIEDWKEDRQYDVVTCMFALHYFFVSEAALKQFLRNVANNLKDGGYFVGTVPDGKRINQCIRSAKTFNSPMLKIEARWEGAPSTFGSAYVCAIGDTVTGGEKGTEGSLEYLVYRNVLQGVAAQVGLKPVLDYGDPEMEAMFDPGDKNQLFKHFAPEFPESDKSLERASALFTAFAFQKTTGEVTLPGKRRSGGVTGGYEVGNKRKYGDAANREGPSTEGNAATTKVQGDLLQPLDTIKKRQVKRRAPGPAPAAAAEDDPPVATD